MNPHSHKVGSKVLVNDTNLTGTVTEQLLNSTYSYIVNLSNGDSTKFRETELEALPEYINEVRMTPDSLLIHSSELAYIVMIDWKYKQVEIKYESDGAMTVIGFNELRPVRGEGSD